MTNVKKELDQKRFASNCDHFYFHFKESESSCQVPEHLVKSGAVLNIEEPSCGCCSDLHIDAQGGERAQNLKQQSRRMLLHSCKSTSANTFSAGYLNLVEFMDRIKINLVLS